MVDKVGLLLDVQALKADIDKLLSERQGWLDEIERLRAALKDIADKTIPQSMSASLYAHVTLSYQQQAREK